MTDVEKQNMASGVYLVLLMLAMTCRHVLGHGRLADGIQTALSMGELCAVAVSIIYQARARRATRGAYYNQNGN